MKRNAEIISTKKIVLVCFWGENKKASTARGRIRVVRSLSRLFIRPPARFVFWIAIHQPNAIPTFQSNRRNGHRPITYISWLDPRHLKTTQPQLCCVHSYSSASSSCSETSFCKDTHTNGHFMLFVYTCVHTLILCAFYAWTILMVCIAVQSSRIPMQVFIWDMILSWSKFSFRTSINSFRRSKISVKCPDKSI